jgi:hypothetical protein
MSVRASSAIQPLKHDKLQTLEGLSLEVHTDHHSLSRLGAGNSEGNEEEETPRERRRAGLAPATEKNRKRRLGHSHAARPSAPCATSSLLVRTFEDYGEKVSAHKKRNNDFHLPDS